MDDISRQIKTELLEALERSGEPVLSRTLFVTSLAGHASTGRTTHRRDGRILPKPTSLAISKVGSKPGVFLFYYDERGDVLTDTYHDTVEGAFEQAQFEFNIIRSEWEKVLD
jgi:hypothetical protein